MATSREEEVSAQHLLLKKKSGSGSGTQTGGEPPRAPDPTLLGIDVDM